MVGDKTYHIIFSHKEFFIISLPFKIFQYISIVSEQRLEQIVASAKHKLVKFDKKDIYILAGMPYRHVDIVVEGEMVARMVSLSGKSVEVSRLVVGDLVAPAFIFAKDNLMPVSVENLDDARLFLLDH